MDEDSRVFQCRPPWIETYEMPVPNFQLHIKLQVLFFAGRSLEKVLPSTTSLENPV
jgi:hypothetical protein